MNVHDRLDHLREATSDALVRLQTLRKERARLTGPPRPGDVFLLDAPSTTDVRWVVLLRHPERSSLLVVPADEHPLVGLADVGVPASAPSGPMTLRCGFTLWLSPDDFRSEMRLGRISDAHLSLAHDKLEEIARGKLTGSLRMRETEAMADYDDWLDEISREVHSVEEAFRNPSLVLSFADFAAPEVEEDESDRALAAAGSPASPSLTAALSEPTSRPVPPVRVLAFPWPGEIVLVHDASGLRVLFRSAGGHAPPPIQVVENGGSRPLEWNASPDGNVHSVRVDWQDGRAAFRIGEGGRIKEVVVQR